MPKPIWWNPGLFIKLNQAQLTGQYQEVLNELRSLPGVQGFKIAISMGEHESSPTSRNFSSIGRILDDLASMTIPRRLIISLSTRAFLGSQEGIDELLPKDLQQKEGVYSWTNAGKVASVQEYRYAWPYRKSLRGGVEYGYNLKLWNSPDGEYLKTRVKAFTEALCKYIAAHPNGHLVEHISESESVIGSPVVPRFSTRDGNTTRDLETYKSKAELAVHAKDECFKIRKYYLQGLNFTPQFVDSQAPKLYTARMGFSTPDHHAGLNLRSVLKYFKGGKSSLSGQVVLAAECQTDSYQSTMGPNGDMDWPDPLWLYNRAVELGNTHFVIQRTTLDRVGGKVYDYWSRGYPGRGSMVGFLKNHSGIINDPQRAGGMNTAIPACLAGLNF